MIKFRTFRGGLFGLLAAGLLVSCAPQQQFVWGTYETSLYGYYKNPEQLENLMKSLEKAIAEGEEAAKSSAAADGTKPRRIAPGLYAEYGYLLMLKNDGAKANIYFEKEKASWPESMVLMDKLIAVVDQSDRRISSKSNGEKTAK